MSATRASAAGALDRSPQAAAAPVGASERIVAIDSLRGVAVLGILVMNIYAFAMPFAAYTNPLIMGGREWHNLGTWFATHLLFDQKFMTIFSILFGAGIVLMTGRIERRDIAPAATFYRRQFWLLLIGAAHGYLLWFGDILFHYAFVGMLVYPLRRMEARKLIAIGCLLLPVALFMSYGGAAYMAEQQETAVRLEAKLAEGDTLTDAESETLEEARAMRSFIAPTDEDVDRDLEAYRGSYVDTVAHRAPLVASMHLQSTFAFMIWRVGGLMLLGMAFMKLGILSGERSRSFYRQLMLGGYALGLPLCGYSAWDLYQHGFDGLYVFRIGMVPNYVGSVLVALGHIGAVMLIVKSRVLEAVMLRFAAVGRMALTNYLMHSLVMTTIFYGYGLSLYGSVPRFWQMGFVLGLVALQLWLSPVWFRYYRFGPLEWAWRSLTYWRAQPLAR